MHVCLFIYLCIISIPQPCLKHLLLFLQSNTSTRPQQEILTLHEFQISVWLYNIECVCVRVGGWLRLKKSFKSVSCQGHVFYWMSLCERAVQRHGVVYSWPSVSPLI